MTKGTIFDIGMHDGQDTAFYLAQGYRVVAVEADPVLVRAAEKRFVAEMEEGSLVIVPHCIANTEGEETVFWINTVNSALSSFDRSVAERMGHPVESITLKSIKLSTLLLKYGVPYYLKIDIEMADRYCIEDLRPEKLPPFLSVELTDPKLLLHLRDLGYSRFKIIEQKTLTCLDERIAWDSYFFGVMCRDLQSRNFSLRVQRRLARWLLPLARAYEATRIRPTKSSLGRSWKFPEGCSGPFGDETPGDWTNWEEAIYVWSRHLCQHKRRNAELWCDLHVAL